MFFYKLFVPIKSHNGARAYVRRKVFYISLNLGVDDRMATDMNVVISQIILNKIKTKAVDETIIKKIDNTY